MAIYSFTQPTHPCYGVHVHEKDKSHVSSWKGVEVEDDFKLEIMTVIEASNEDTVATKGQRGDTNF